METITKLILFYLKQVPDKLIKRIENQTPDPCPIRNKEIFSNNILMSCLILICGLMFHWDCFTICATANCPICDKVLEQNIIKQNERIRYSKKFFNLYFKITKAESQNKISNQEIIKCYFSF
ncbi:1923_t:CDS:2, partial [Funneliformis geosporum]